ncbi:MFS transporter [Thalassospiraceae bacterium LMO-JJ14]|nr:MFS transporter [Thalassospiraceae bacterium LMO-JJ14]
MTARRAIIFLAIGETIYWAGLYYIFAALLVQWEAAEAWPKTSITAAFTGAILMAAVFAPIAGRLVDQGRGPHVLTFAALTAAMLVALLPFTNSVWVFGLIWLGVGACLGGCLYETCFSLITRTRGDRARRDITLVTLVAGLAGTLSFPLSNSIADAFGWHAAAWTLAGLVVFVGVPLVWTAARFLENEYQKEHAVLTANDDGVEKPVFSIRNVLRKPAFWLLAIGFAILGGNHGVIINHILPILTDRGLSADAAVITASMIGPMQVAGRLAMMAAERRVSSHGITTACFVGVACAGTALYFSQAFPALVVAFVILQGSGHGVTSIMRPVITREILGSRNFGAISGAMAVPYLLSWAMAPVAGSLLWEAGGYDLAILVVIGLACSGLVLYRSALRFAS